MIILTEMSNMNDCPLSTNNYAKFTKYFVVVVKFVIINLNTNHLYIVQAFKINTNNHADLQL